jgi:hypothetical protein
MQNILNLSSVVDGVRSNAGSALKSVQRQFEESALKAAGLGEDEEALYRLNKHAQTYLRAADAMHQASVTLADDFAEAMEDFALRDIARKLRDTSKNTTAQQLAALSKNLAEPVKQASDAESSAARQRLIGKAFQGLLDANLECFRAASASVEEAHNSAQKALEDLARPPPTVGQSASRRNTVNTSTPPAPAQKAPAIDRRNTAPAASLDFDLIGGMDATATTKASPAVSKAPAPEKSNDLLDLDFGMGNSNVPTSGTGTGSPPDRSGGYSASVPLDFDFHATAPVHTTSAPCAPSTNGGGSGGGLLGGLTWTAKEHEDESCIKARVDAWQDGKNLRTMLCSLHEVAPANSGWAPVTFEQLEHPSDVKMVYRKAVLTVHPDKVDQSKTGEKMLAHLVFQSLCDQWNIFRSSS